MRLLYYKLPKHFIKFEDIETSSLHSDNTKLIIEYFVSLQKTRNELRLKNQMQFVFILIPFLQNKPDAAYPFRNNAL